MNLYTFKGHKIYLASLFALLASCGQTYDFNVLPGPAVLQIGLVQGSDTFSPLASGNLGKQPLGSVSTVVYTLKNTGESRADVQKMEMWSESATVQNFRLENRCSSLIEPGAECQLELAFDPRALGTLTDKLQIKFEDGRGNLESMQFDVEGFANNLAFLKFETANTTIGDTTLGYDRVVLINVVSNLTKFANLNLDIRPAGSVGLGFDGIASSAFSLVPAQTTCGVTITGDCRIAVRFTPEGVGTVNKSLSLSYYNSAEALKIRTSVNGVGTTAVVLGALASSPFALGKVVKDTVRSFSIPVAFSGSIPVDVASMKITNDAGNVFRLNSAATSCALTQIGGDCQVTVSFAPVAYQDYSANLEIAYTSKNQNSSSPLIVNLSGTGAHPALLNVSYANAPVGTVAYGEMPIGKLLERELNVYNAGDVAAESLPATLTFTNNTSGDYTVSYGTPSCHNLAAKASCKIKIGYRPTAPGASTADLQFGYFDGIKNVTLPLVRLTGTGTSALRVEFLKDARNIFDSYGVSHAVDFGNIMIGDPNLPSAKTVSIAVFGSHASQPITLTPAVLPDPFEFVDGTFPGTGGTCGTILNPATPQPCTLKIRLKTTTLAPANTTITKNFGIGYTDGADGVGSLALSIHVTPRLPPTLSFTPNQGFTTRPAKETKTNYTDKIFEVSNDSLYFGVSGLTASIVGGDTTKFSVLSKVCAGVSTAPSTPVSLAKNAKCNVLVRFNSASEGTFNSTLKIVYFDGIESRSQSSALNATADAKVLLTASAIVLNFGTVYVGDTIVPKVVLLSYLGDSDWTHTGAPAGPFTMTAPAICGSRTNCTLSFDFDITKVGDYEKSFDFTYSPGFAAPAKITFTLRGKVQDRTPKLKLTGNAFAKTMVGSTSDQLIELENIGSAEAPHLSLPLSLNSGFSYTATGGPGKPNRCANNQSLAPAAKCSLQIRFTPDRVAAVTSAFAVKPDAGSLATEFTLQATGTAPIRVFAGGNTTCLRDEMGQGRCWGANDSGQLGNGSTLASPGSSVINFGAGASLVKFAVGPNHVCALINTAGAEGVVTCWGNNLLGRLGLGDETLRTSPVVGGTLSRVNLGAPAIDIAVGFEHTCAALTNGLVKCWGGNSSGQVSPTAGTHSLIPVTVNLHLMGETPTLVSASAGHSCVTLSDGHGKCWGNNFYGQAGVPNTNDSLTVAASNAKLALGTGFNATAVHVSPGAYTCALSDAGVVKCFGKTFYNDESRNGSAFYGVLGACWSRASYESPAGPCGSTHDTRYGYLPADMGDALRGVSLGSGKVSKIALGSQHTCVLKESGTVQCWGVGEHGQLGTGNDTNLGEQPSEMGANLATVLAAVTDIASGNEHSCAVLADNTVKCWGAATSLATGLPLIYDDTTNYTVTALPVVYDGRN